MVTGVVSLRDIFQRTSACSHSKEEDKGNAQSKENANDGENSRHIATEHASAAADAYHNHGDDFLENRNGQTGKTVVQASGGVTQLRRVRFRAVGEENEAPREVKDAEAKAKNGGDDEAFAESSKGEGENSRASVHNSEGDFTSAHVRNTGS